MRADRIYALVPLEGEERGDRRRTLVHVEGVPEPLVASRSEAAIMHDLEEGVGRLRRARGASAGQDPLF